MKGQGLKLISEEFRNNILQLKLKTPPDIVFGLINLEGSAIYEKYIYSLGKDPIINSDKGSIANKNPGDIVSDSKVIRDSLLNKNLKTPREISFGILNNTDSVHLTQQYLEGKGEDTLINDFNVKNPGDINNDSKDIRDKLLKKNLETPNDISTSIASNYITERGVDTVINDYIVNDPGTIDTDGDDIRNKLFNKNRPFDITDLAENDPLYNHFSEYGYIYSSIIESIGKLTVINDISIPNAINISALSTQPPDLSLQLGLLLNRYTPTNIEAYETKVTTLPSTKNSYKYQQVYSSGVFQDNIPDYTVEELLNLSVSTSPINGLMNLDPMEHILSGDKTSIINDSLLMNIAALQLKMTFENRIADITARKTLLRSNIDEAITDPIKAYKLLTGEESFWEKDYTISKPTNIPSWGVEVLTTLLGGVSPLMLLKDKRKIYLPNVFLDEGNEFIDDYTDDTLENTGTGQKFQLFAHTGINKYRPKFNDKKASEGSYYIGNPQLANPLYFTQDIVGDQVFSNEKLTDSITEGVYSEPGIKYGTNNKGVSEYNSIETNLVWSSKNTQEYYLNTDKNENEQRELTVRYNDVLSYNQRFREYSILKKTQQLTDKGINKYNSPIDQLTTKFYDGYDLYSRGSAVITPNKIPIRDKDGNILNYKYKVPGLTPDGKRNNEEMYSNSTFCRVWTKNKPYSKISDLTKFKELNRFERNSVLDRNGNLNIVPTDLNVTNVSNRDDMDTGLSEAEDWAGKRARKYMFSIENLAWRDSIEFNNLPNAEKGMNGGRVMWFPPYELTFTDDTSANWTPHNFLGRSEPIYSYNNSQRSGTLSWKIIVDHPSILNIIAKKELNKLSDNEVDEILNAFWSGCIEFDTFELARIWGQFSENDIDYFKKLILQINTSQSNDVIKNKIAKVFESNPIAEPTTNNTSFELPKPTLKDYNLFFENDVPLELKKYKTPDPLYNNGKILPFDEYFERYKILCSDTTGNTNNVEIIKGEDGINMQYVNVIGNLSDDKNFFKETTESAWDGYEKQFTNLKTELIRSDYNDFSLKINIDAKASPLGNTEYNKKLSYRRFISTVKWIILKVFKDKIYNKDNVLITSDNIDDTLFKDNPYSITVLKNGSKEYKDEIKFNLLDIKNRTTTEVIKDIHQNPSSIKDKNNIDNIYFSFSVNNTDPNKKGEYYCFETDEKIPKGKTITINKGKTDEKTIDKKYVSSLTPKNRSFKDIACSVLSNVSSYNRRATVTIEPYKTPEQVNPPVLNNTIPNDAIMVEDRTTFTLPTKREIAQNILNKLMTEQDYFSVLSQDSPIVYQSIKEKIKYFQPSFHSMTPEGLNARLTFLQQCLRPGEALKLNKNDKNDAKNIAFGKPPVCVLRIGDFYNTKIIIENLNISYEQLFDLNPEGIGVQPMIANIQLSFKYIGGSGLRKYVNELQNALSFNYYANTDIYDDRTYANKDVLERELINLETNYFLDNALDLQTIVNNVELFNINNENTFSPKGLLGNVVNNRKPTTAGGEYLLDTLSATPFNFIDIYQQYSVVENDGVYYLRNADYPNEPSKINDLKPDVNDSNSWKEIEIRNYGEEAFQKEFGLSNKDAIYYNWYDISYYNIFNDLYTSYASIIEKDILFNKVNEDSILFDIILKQEMEVKNNPLDNSNISSYYKSISDNKNYLEYGKFYKDLTPLKLHLYPQDHLFKVGNGKTLTSNNGLFNDNDRYNPGNLTGDSNKDAEIVGIYLKDYISVEPKIKDKIDEYTNQMINKINFDLSHFWFYKETPEIKLKGYEKYLETFEEPQKEIFRNWLIDKIKDYSQNIYAKKITQTIGIMSETDRFITLLNGVSMITSGYDIKPNPNGLDYFEVIPNDRKLTQNINNIFGYNPYNEYKYLKDSTYILNTYDNIKNIIDDKENKLNDYFSLGNGLYYFKQVSSHIRNISNLIPEDYTKDVNLPEILKLNGTTSTQNIGFSSGVTLNEEKNITLNSINAYKDIDYEMQYVFEKINYELLDFSNKTLNVMNNDTFNNVQIVVEKPNELSVYNQFNAKDFEYYFNSSNYIKPIEDFKNNSVYYYNNNDIDFSSLFSDYVVKFKGYKFNDGIPFDTNITLSSFIDLFFIDVFNNLIKENDLFILLNMIKTGPAPTRNVSNDPKKRNKDIEQRFKQMEKTLNIIFDEIKVYCKSVLSKLDELKYIMDEDSYSSIININKALDNNLQEYYDVNTTVKSLIKGTEDDYTLTLKQTKDIPLSVKNNYKSFTNKRDLFTIITE